MSSRVKSSLSLIRVEAFLISYSTQTPSGLRSFFLENPLQCLLLSLTLLKILSKLAIHSRSEAGRQRDERLAHWVTIPLC